MIFYYTIAKRNASYTCRYFGISRQCFHKWLKRFEQSQENVKFLKTKSRAPKRTRNWEVTSKEQRRVVALRKKYMRLGKMKLKTIYEKRYKGKVSAHKIQRIINRYNLYSDPVKKEKEDKRRKRSRQKKRIQQLTKQTKVWFLLKLDTIVIYQDGLKRYILTAVDYAGKFGYARMYKNKSSRSATDFLYRLKYLIDAPIENIQTDNGSEFAGEFERTVEKLNLERYFSRNHTPTDNAEVERFNQTLEYEWLYDGNLTMDCDKFNKRLTNWLIEYNWVRPHETLDYQTPIEYIVENTEVSTMYPSRTGALLTGNLPLSLNR